MTSLCSLRAQIIYSKKWPNDLPRTRKAFLPAILAVRATIFFVCLFACLFVCLFNDVFGDIIWILLYLDLCITKKLIIMELSDLKRSGYDVKLCLFFPQVSKQNELKL